MFINLNLVTPVLQCCNIDYSREVVVPQSDGSKDVILSSEPPVALPPYDDYNINRLIEAGVNLQYVNPNVLGSSLSESAAADKIVDIVSSNSSAAPSLDPAAPTLEPAAPSLEPAALSDNNNSVNN